MIYFLFWWNFLWNNKISDYFVRVFESSIFGHYFRLYVVNDSDIVCIVFFICFISFVSFFRTDDERFRVSYSLRIWRFLLAPIFIGIQSGNTRMEFFEQICAVTVGVLSFLIKSNLQTKQENCSAVLVIFTQFAKLFLLKFSPLWKFFDGYAKNLCVRTIEHRQNFSRI